MIAAIIQARMASTRLPGKIMKRVMGKPLLGHLIERLRHCHYLDKIILATTLSKKDDLIAEYADEERLLYYRGSEYDVLSRYYEAAKKFGVHHIMRITSDCPLIDPKICDQSLQTYLRKKVDHVHLAPTFADGLSCEIFSFKALEIAYKNAKMNSEREHVTLYLRNHPELLKTFVLENETDDSKYRITVDHPEDFEVVKAIIEALYKKDLTPFNFKEIKRFLNEHPEIQRLNSHIIRGEGLIKSLEEDSEVSGNEIL